MLERELKFHVPADKRALLEKHLHAEGAIHLPLHACYFDTSKYELAQRKVALRLRQEGDRWVQTLKMPGPDELSRIEINHPRPGPTLDLSVYQNTAVDGILDELECPLSLRYETQVQRLVLKIEGQAGEIELAYDQGIIKAGGLTLPLCELELELVSGDTATLFNVAKQYLEEYKLVLDLRSKAERGDALARIAPDVTHKVDALNTAASGASSQAALLPQLFKSRRAGSISLSPNISMHEAYQRCASDCMNQIIRNATFLAGVDSQYALTATHVDYVHQIRVGIRRIRSCWKLFGKWVALNEAELGAELLRYFSQLGEARDRDVVGLVITPRLVSAGMPELTLPTHKNSDHTLALAASPQFQVTMLTLLQHLTVDENASSTDDPSPAKPSKALAKRLNKWMDAVCKRGAHFSELSIEEQHRLRKRVKGLRYSTEFSASLLSGKRLARVRNALTAVQSTLGDLNDLYIATSVYQPLVATQPQAYFALGWLRAMQEQKKIEAQADFVSLGKAGHFK